PRAAWLCFFFSSRRRHTRFSRDWSSDVCSSDLGVLQLLGEADDLAFGLLGGVARGLGLHLGHRPGTGDLRDLRVEDPAALDDMRSEERRVGKECRARGGPWPYEKKREWGMRRGH